MKIWVGQPRQNCKWYSRKKNTLAENKCAKDVDRRWLYNICINGNTFVLHHYIHVCVSKYTSEYCVRNENEDDGTDRWNFHSISSVGCRYTFIGVRMWWWKAILDTQRILKNGGDILCIIKESWALLLIWAQIYPCWTGNFCFRLIHAFY